MASQSGNNDAACPKGEIPRELRARDLPSKRLLGKGLASIVYETEWNGKRFARKDFIGVPSGTFQKEAKLLVGLKEHENVVKTLAWTVDKLSCSLVLEYVEEDLQDLLQKRKESQKRPAGIAFGSQSERNHTYPLKLAEALDILLQFARGMEFLHRHKISHGDLKTKNILIKKDGDKELVKVADFGLVRTKSKSISYVSRQARKFDMVQWQAPEILERLLLEYSEETSSESDSDKERAGPPRVTDGRGADVYSFAVTCSQILIGEDPYPYQNWKELVPKIVSDELRPNIPARFPPLLKSFLESCWRKAPAERPTFSKILAMLDLLHDPKIVDLMERQLLYEDWMKPEFDRTPLEKWSQVVLEVNPRENSKLVPRQCKDRLHWIIEIQPPRFRKPLRFGNFKVEDLDRAVDAINYYMELKQEYNCRDSEMIFARKKLEGIQFRDLEPSCEQFIRVRNQRKYASYYFIEQVKKAIDSVTRKYTVFVKRSRTGSTATTSVSEDIVWEPIPLCKRKRTEYWYARGITI